MGAMNMLLDAHIRDALEVPAVGKSAVEYRLTMDSPWHRGTAHDHSHEQLTE